MPEHNPGQMGGTMRLGKRRTIFKSTNSVLRMESFCLGPAADVFYLPCVSLCYVFQVSSMEMQNMWMKGTDIALRYAKLLLNCHKNVFFSKLISLIIGQP